MNGETKEKGIFADIHKNLKAINGATIDVGYFPESMAKGDADLYVAEYAFWNDQGVPGRIPERPFLSTILKENFTGYIKLSRIVAFDAISGKITVKQALNKVGNKITSDVKMKITDLRTPPNAPGTIKAKGSSNPLIDEGTMRNATKYKVNV